MCTVLITYSTPPPPSDEPRRSAAGGDEAGDAVDQATTSVASTTAGIDEAIAATIADELSLAGHQVTCRPCVATPVTGGYDLVVDVDRLQVTHRSTPSAPAPRRGRALLPERGPSPGTDHDVEYTIPMTWAADWRAVDAWARTVADGLARHLELQLELTRVRAALERCRTQLRVATSQPAATTAAEAFYPPGLDRGQGRHRHRRLSPAGSSREP